MSFELKNFLKNYELSEYSTESHSHLSMRGGKFNIPFDQNKVFLSLYFESLKQGYKHYLVECFKPAKLFNFIVDIEIKEQYNTQKISINDDLLKIIIENLNELLTETFNKKPHAVVSKRADYLIHINYPNIQINITRARIIIQKLQKKMFINFPYIDWARAIDNSIYCSGKGIRLLGSEPPPQKKILDNEFSSYRIYDVKQQKYHEITYNDLLETSIGCDENDNIISQLDFHEKNITTSGEKEIENTNPILLAYLHEIKTKFNDYDLTNINSIKKVYYSSDIPCIAISLKDKVCPIQDRIHKRRSDPLYLWITKDGARLRCYDEDCHNSYYVHIKKNASKQENVFNNEDKKHFVPLNQQVKEEFFTEKLNIPEIKINQIQEGIVLNDEIIQQLTYMYKTDYTHHDIANLIFYLYKNRFRIDYVGQKYSSTWYEFKNNKFYKDSNALQILLAEEVPQYLMLYDKYIKSHDNQLPQDNKIKAIIANLKNDNYIKSVLKRAAHIFYYNYPDFATKINNNKHLMCFDNGVYDFDLCEFRPGKIEDALIYSTNYSYVEYNENNIEIQQINEFLQKIFSNKEVFYYQMQLFSMCLDGSELEKFHIWTGNGCHKKGSLIKMYNGTCLKVEDIKINDLVLGDNQTPRKVLMLHRGYDEMYKINAKLISNNISDKNKSKKISFVVNKGHILNLYFFVLYPYSVTTEYNNSITVSWLEYDNEKIIKSKSINVSNSYHAKVAIKNILKSRNTITESFSANVSLATYLKYNNTLKYTSYLHTCDSKYYSFDVEKEPLNDLYYGFELDGNHLYCDEFNIIHHNSNGKSKLCQLLAKTFGDYWTEAPVSLLTQKRNSSSSCSPELIDFKGRKIITFQEPDENTAFHFGIMKQLVSDYISGRMLYKPQEKFKLFAKFFLSCNTIPDMKASDGGVWRRIVIVQFENKFVEKPTQENHFKLDENLNKKINTWAPYFMSMLIHFYNIYKNKKLIQPEAIKNYTSEIRKEFDLFSQFVDEILEEDKNSSCTFLEIFEELQKWCLRQNIRNSFKKIEVKKYIKDLYGREKRINQGDKIIDGFNIKLKRINDELIAE